VRLRVVALLGSSSRYASIVLPSALLAAHTSARGPGQLLVQAEPGTDHLRDRLASALPGHEVRRADALADDFDSGLQVDAWITYAVVAVIVAYAAMSLVNSLVAALAGRRRELALLALVGATRHQVRRMLDTEALVIGAIGTGLGTIVAVAGLIPLAIATAGTPLPSGPVWVFAAVVAIVAALVLLPTRVMLSTTLRHGKVSDAATL
jgi:putative ABC transport system permease protein